MGRVRMAKPIEVLAGFVASSVGHQHAGGSLFQGFGGRA